MKSFVKQTKSLGFGGEGYRRITQHQPGTGHFRKFDTISTRFYHIETSSLELWLQDALQATHTSVPKHLPVRSVYQDSEHA